jgi:hypothetical protein
MRRRRICRQEEMEEEKEGQRQSTLLVTGWRVERGRESGDNNKGDDDNDDHDDKDKDDVSASLTFYL